VLVHPTPTAFGTLMALEPAIGVLLGLLVLGQDATAVQLLGIALVVLAGAAAQRRGRRSSTVPRGTGTHSELDLVGSSRRYGPLATSAVAGPGTAHDPTA
jgi:inner membrane transporter RhtA